MNDKKKDGGPQIRRDKHNILDKSHADEVVKDLTEKLIGESRDFQKEISFRNARTNRRDIVVKFVLYQRNTVNGKIVTGDAADPEYEKLSDQPLDPYRYKYFDHVDGEILAQEMPMPFSTSGKWMMGCFKAVANYLARMNVFNEV